MHTAYIWVSQEMCVTCGVNSGQQRGNKELEPNQQEQLRSSAAD